MYLECSPFLGKERDCGGPIEPICPFVAYFILPLLAGKCPFVTMHCTQVLCTLSNCPNLTTLKKCKIFVNHDFQKSQFFGGHSSYNFEQIAEGIPIFISASIIKTFSPHFVWRRTVAAGYSLK